MFAKNAAATTVSGFGGMMMVCGLRTCLPLPPSRQTINTSDAGYDDQRFSSAISLVLCMWIEGCGILFKALSCVSKSFFKHHRCCVVSGSVLNNIRIPFYGLWLLTSTWALHNDISFHLTTSRRDVSQGGLHRQAATAGAFWHHRMRPDKKQCSWQYSGIGSSLWGRSPEILLPWVAPSHNVTNFVHLVRGLLNLGGAVVEVSMIT